MVKTEHKIQSAESTKPMASTSSSPSSSSSCKKKYKGVRMRSWGSWVSEIRAPNQKTRIWLGSYSTPEAAARAYDAALLCLKGTSSAPNLNFPITSTHHIPPPNTIMSPKSIQKVAAAAAAATPPPPSSPSMSSSSPSDQIVSYANCDQDQESDNNTWYYNFDGMQSPKYIEQMFGGAIFDPVPIIDDQIYEEGDIRLWSFC